MYQRYYVFTGLSETAFTQAEPGAVTFRNNAGDEVLLEIVGSPTPYVAEGVETTEQTIAARFRYRYSASFEGYDMYPVVAVTKTLGADSYNLALNVSVHDHMEQAVRIDVDTGYSNVVGHPVVSVREYDARAHDRATAAVIAALRAVGEIEVISD